MEDTTTTTTTPAATPDLPPGVEEAAGGPPKKRGPGRPKKSAAAAPPKKPKARAAAQQEAPQAPKKPATPEDAMAFMEAMLPEPHPMVEMLWTMLAEELCQTRAEATNNGTWVDALNTKPGQRMLRDQARFVQGYVPDLSKLPPKVLFALVAAISSLGYVKVVRRLPKRPLKVEGAKPRQETAATHQDAPPPPVAEAGKAKANNNPPVTEAQLEALVGSATTLAQAASSTPAVLPPEEQPTGSLPTAKATVN